MSYRVLVLPERSAMTPAVARKVRALVEAGAVIIGPKPTASPSLQDYPECDAEVRRIADELWDSGKVISGRPVTQVLGDLKTSPDFQADAADLLWIHRRIGSTDAYFVSNQEESGRLLTVRSAWPACSLNCGMRPPGKLAMPARSRARTA